MSNQGTHFHACHEATSDSVKLHKLRKLIADLSEKQGRDKEFISLYLPTKTSMDAVVATLKKEADECPTKSESAKDRLQEALKNVAQHLRQQKELPENGLAVFAGFVADGLEKEVLRFEEIVPPKPISKYLFAVDNHFLIEPLREMLRDQKIVGFIALDAKEAGFGILNGERLELIGNITSGIPGKTGKGGQSQRRYERERDMEITYYFHRIAEHAAKMFLENQKITVLMVGGPGQTKDEFLKGDFLHYELKEALLDTVDTPFAGENGVREILKKSSEMLKNMCAPEERRSVQRLLTELAKQTGLATYGMDSVLTALKKGEVEVALVAESTDMIENTVVCKRCGLSKAKILDKKNTQAIREMISTPCERCHSIEYEEEQKDIVDVLEDAASQTDARVEVISTESEEKGKLAALGGFAALLRYRPNKQS